MEQEKIIGASPHRHKKAFTMVEMMMVVIIIGLLFVLLVSNMDFSGTKAKTASAQAELQSLQLAYQDMAASDSGFPDTLELLKTKTNRIGLTGIVTSVQTDGKIQYLDSGCADPWGQNYRIYLCGGGSDNESVAILCSGVDRQFGTTDDLGAVVTYKSSGLYSKVDVENTEGKVLHVAGNWSVTQAANCKDGTVGKRVPICAICGLVMKDDAEEIPAEHSLIAIAGTAPTCTSVGRTQSATCSVCGEVIEEAREIAMVPHSYGAWSKVDGDFGSNCVMWQRKCEMCNGIEYAYTTGDKPD